ncbi:MAG: FG-GAP-like repeat-containing protein [Gemmataceae bacterium]
MPVNGPLGTFSVHLNAPVDASTVVPENFQLVGAGKDNAFGTPDDITVPLTIANTQPIRIGTNEILLSEDQILLPGLYRLTVKSGGLLDPFGNAVVAKGTGGDLVVNFGVANSVTGTAYVDVNGTGTHSPGDPVLPGQPIFVDLNNNGSPDILTGSNANVVAIPDDPNATVSSTIHVSGLTGNVANVTVSMDLSHPQPGDLRIWLVSPQGTRILLSGNRYFQPKSASFLLTIDFDDAASLLTSNPNAIAPDQPLATFNGENGNGDWTLEITDTTPGDSGSLLGWSINVTDEPMAVTDANGHYSIVGAVPPGSYSILPVLQSGELPVNNAPFQFEALPLFPYMLDVGVQITGAVTGFVTQGNGTAVVGARVYDDVNANGRIDPGEPSALTVTGGSYLLKNLPLGVHTLRIQTPLGYDVSQPAGGTITVNISDLTTIHPQNNFTLTARSGPPLPSLNSVSPDMRNSGIPSFDLSFNLPVSNLTIGDFTLTRNGVNISLDGVTLVGGDGVYHLIGMSALTAPAGQYHLSVTTPNSPNAPSSSTSWIVDLTPPSVQTLSITRSAAYLPATDATLIFSEPVSGLTLSNFTLTRNGQAIALIGAALSGSGTQYSLSGLAALTTTYGNYVLSVTPGSAPILDAAGNSYSGTSSISFSVGAPPVVYQDRIVTATAEGTLTTVNVMNTAGTMLFTLMPFGPTFTGGAHVTTADVNGDGVADIVVGSGSGRTPQVFTFDGRNGLLIGSFFAFEASFTGGVNVATADFNRDGKPDLIVTPDLGGGPRVRVLSPDGITVYSDFFGIADPNFRGGARATAGDLNGDGTPDLIVAAGFGGGPRIAAYDGKTIGNATPTKLFGDFFAFEPTLRNGVTLATADLNGDGVSDLIIGGGPGGAPRVLALNGMDLVSSGTRTVLANFFAGNSSHREGTTLAAKDLNGDGNADLLTTDGPTVNVYYATTLRLNGSNPIADRTFDPFGTLGGIYVG